MTWLSKIAVVVFEVIGFLVDTEVVRGAVMHTAPFWWV
tara:strand:+ start:1916 stop:2029 length:114 start_codon:yes stop_codon:yes gene_type:complete